MILNVSHSKAPWSSFVNLRSTRKCRQGIDLERRGSSVLGKLSRRKGTWLKNVHNLTIKWPIKLANNRSKFIIKFFSIAKQPHSIVICRGKTGKNLNDLMMDFRRVMSPFTASNLKVKKANVLKDFLTIAGPMNVKHLVTFSKTRETVGMRLITVPKGPTMSFAIDEFVLKKKVSTFVPYLTLLF